MRTHSAFQKAVVSILLCWIVLGSAARAEEPSFRIDYSVEVSSIENQQFHVIAQVKNIHEKSLEFTLPIWTPGWYTLENYARNMSRFVIKGPDGKRLNHERSHVQAWRVSTEGLEKLTIEFDYHATQLALNQAKIATDFAFFTGTELFVSAGGHRDCPSTVTLKCPADWDCISALKETDRSFEFSASNYDELVDSPVLMGKFDARKFDAGGKPHWFVSVPKNTINDPRAKEITAGLSKIIDAASALFHGLPYDKYTFFYFFTHAETRAAGGLEHANSHVCFFPHGAGTPQTALEWMAAHEFFHVWNAKRIRPAQLWPYDYSRQVETPLLWFSEGFTTYYGSVLLYRAGLNSRDDFYEAASGSVAQVESSPARDFISPAESSTSTWLGYDSHIPFEISYYLTGRNLAMLLDLSILHDTSGQHGLDDVMRALYTDFYLQNKGFETRDVLAEINKISGHDYTAFFGKHIEGIERLPYAEILGYAGMKIEFSKRRDVFGNISVKISENAEATDEQKKLRDVWMKR